MESKKPIEEFPGLKKQPLSLEEKLKILESLRGITKGGPSMADELQKERRSDKW